jgi:hypothetical protein
MYYTNIKDYDQLLNQHKDNPFEGVVLLAITIGLVTAILLL